MITTGIFGGSFNPIHNGHITLAQQLREAAGIDEVWLMVSSLNPLKRQSELLDDELRLELARQALADIPHIQASDYEFHLPRPSYTWHTLQSLSRDFPDRKFVLMIGGDNWQCFNQWYRADDILKNYQLIVYPRRGSNISSDVLPDNVTIVEADYLDISSTDIRRRIRHGQPIKGLVPDCIVDKVIASYTLD